MSKHSERMETRCSYASITFYSIAVGCGISSFVMAAYMREAYAIALGSVAAVSAVLSILTYRASLRWRQLR